MRINVDISIIPECASQFERHGTKATLRDTQQSSRCGGRFEHRVKSLPAAIPHMSRTTKYQRRQLLRFLGALSLPAGPQLEWKECETAIVIVRSRYAVSDYATMQELLHGMLDIDGSLGSEETQDEVVELLNTFAD